MKLSIRGSKIHDMMLNPEIHTNEIITMIYSELKSKKNQKRPRRYKYQDYIKADNYLLFRCAVRYNDVEFMKAHESFKVNQRFLTYLLILSCRYGNGEMIEYLLTTYNLNIVDECYRVLCKKKENQKDCKEILTELLNHYK